MDSRARKNLSSINTELQDVQRIMVQNIDDVLQRGDSLSGKAITLYTYFCWWGLILVILVALYQGPILICQYL